MERLISITGTGVGFILEYEAGAIHPPDHEGIVRTSYIPTALRLEAIDGKTRPVLRYKEIERDPQRDISNLVAYIVRGFLVKNGREFSVSLDLRSATTARAEIPLLRRAFFTDALLRTQSEHIPDVRDVARKSMPRIVSNGERAEPIERVR